MLRVITAIALASVIVLVSDAAEARRLSFRLGTSAAASKPVVPMSKPAAAGAAATSGRNGTFFYMSTNQNRADANQNRPMAAAPRGPVPERGPLHEIASAVDQTPPMPEPPAAQAVAQQPEPPAMQTTPLFISHDAPVARPAGRPAEKVVASAQPVRTVYCTKQASGACAPF